VTNQAPIITRVISDVKTVKPGGSVQIEVSADDEDGDILTYYYDATDGDISGSGSKVQWTAPSYEGAFIIDVWVSDGEEESKRQSVSIVVAKPDDGGDDDAFIPGFGAGPALVAMIVMTFYLMSKREITR